MGIGKKVFCYFLILVTLLTLLIAVLWLTSSNATQLAKLHSERFESQMLANELQKDSDELSRMARTYVSTGEQRFKEYFNAISEIREGLRAYPANYNSVYWHLVVDNPALLALTDAGQAASFKIRMRNLNASSNECSHLDVAINLSNKLIKIERLAFELTEKSPVKPYIQDKLEPYDSQASANQASIIKLNANQQKAIELLHSPVYNKVKAQIMLQINLFMKSLDNRTLQAVQNKQRWQDRLQLAALLLGLALLGFGLFGYWIFKRNISIPVSMARQTLHKLHPDLLSRKPIHQECDDIRQLIGRFTEILTHDYLTNLPNGYSFKQAIREAPLQSKQPYVALYVLNIDKFKIINDAFGQIAGDALLSQLSTVMRSALPPRIKLYRLGGNEFGLIGFFDTPEEIEQLGQQCLEIVAGYTFVWKHQQQNISVSIGISIGKLHEVDSQTFDLLIGAEEACFRSKQLGGNRVTIQHIQDSVKHAENIRLLNELNLALKESSFQLYAQPIMPLNVSLNRPKLEILIRYPDERGLLYTPIALLETAELYRVNSSLDIWVLKKTLQYAAELIQLGWQININIAPQTLLNECFVTILEASLAKHHFPSGSLCLEITERQIVVNISQTCDVMLRLREQGIHFSLDDFGAGFASYGMINQLPLDSLKIDGKLIRKMIQNVAIHDMVRSIVVMANTTNLKVVAEFVRDKETLKLLDELAVEYIQGEIISMPLPVEDFLLSSPQSFLDKLK